MKSEKFSKTIEVVQKEKCCGCHSCYNACPVKAIKMIRDLEGFFYPNVDEEKCIKCGKCFYKCPHVNPPQIFSLDNAYACYAKDYNEHMSSSSGGVFSLIADQVLSEEGIVCGAAFNEDVQVVHLCITKKSELLRLKETKYVQSEIGRVYTEIKMFLELGKVVLFSGTPCQVAGLKSFLGKEYRNLLCIDLICHGVPSPAVWERYLQEIANGKKVVKMTFRNKEKGILNVTLDYMLENGDIIKERYRDSPYIKGFASNLYLRPSCHQCDFKGIQRCSDITIGDFWGISEFHPALQSEFGTS